MSKLIERIKIKEAILNVNDLEKQINYYTEIIGLQLISKDENSASLGIDDNILLKLIKVNSPKNNVTGLYHIAYLVPTRSDLGNILFSFAIRDVEIYGAADHGYSEAIYLYDPEGNGIEIYRDKDKSVWDVKEDGKIVGVTKQLDINGILDSRTSDNNLLLPSNTIIGHMHLSIKDYNDTGNFYQNVLGLDKKFEFPNQAMFLAANEYHHDIAINTWNSKDMTLRKENDLGLQEFSIIINNESDFIDLIKRIDKFNIVYEKNNNEILIKDNQNINIRFLLVN